MPSLIELWDACAADIFPGMTLPMTSCSVERLFSATHRINTHLRASMVTERLNNLTLLSFERELIETLDYVKIISIFNSKARRLCLV